MFIYANKMISSTLHLITRSLAKNVIFPNGKLIMTPCLTLANARDIHITSNAMREFRVGFTKVRSDARGKEGHIDGEYTVEMSEKSTSLFPDVTTKYQLFDGVPYNELHVINVKSTPNNTIMTLTDSKGLVLTLHSAGIEGFKNTKKGTNIAAQQTAITFAMHVLKRGVQTVKLRIQGIGPGRSGVVKGFQLSELKVVSITDDTRVSWHPPRPRKQRRI